MKTQWVAKSQGLAARGIARRLALSVREGSVFWILALLPITASALPADKSENAVVVPREGLAAIACADAPDGMVCIPGGPTIRGANEPHRCDQAHPGDPNKPNHLPAREIWVQTVFMDRTEVTVAAYRECVAQKKCAPGGPAYNDFDRPLQPITGISWFKAVKFCKAQGKHLPTEAEWEKAARGEAGDPYPWGTEEPTCARAVFQDQTGRSCGVRKARPHPEKGRPLEVGSRPPGRYGLVDMAGNVEEWVADWYVRFDRCSAKDCFGVDPRGPCDGSATPCRNLQFKVVKGGSWYWNASHTTGYHRRYWYPSNSPMHHFGFRCAASPAEAAALVKSAAETSRATPSAPR